MRHQSKSEISAADLARPPDNVENVRRLDDSLESSVTNTHFATSLLQRFFSFHTDVRLRFRLIQTLHIKSHPLNDSLALLTIGALLMSHSFELSG